MMITRDSTVGGGRQHQQARADKYNHLHSSQDKKRAFDAIFDGVLFNLVIAYICGLDTLTMPVLGSIVQLGS